MKDTAYEYKPIQRQANFLLHIRDKLKNDNDMALNLAGYGKFPAMCMLSDVVETMCKLEYNYLVWRDSAEMWKDYAQQYQTLLGGYCAESITGERAAELKALVQKWEKQDEEADDENT